MKNADVIEKFLRRENIKAKTKNLYTEDNRLINYQTEIARWNGTPEQTPELQIDTSYYSTTTSKIQTEIYKQVAQQIRYNRNYIIVLNGTDKRIKQAEKVIFEK